LMSRHLRLRLKSNDSTSEVVRLLFEDRLRTLQDEPRARLARVGVAAGMHVVDLGAGKGLYSLLSSGIVGKEGKVYAVEPDSSRAATIARRAREARLDNLQVLVTGAEDLSEIPSSTIDLAFALNSIHHFRDKRVAFAEVNRVLRKDGRFYVRDMVKSWLTMHGTPREEIPNLPFDGFSDKAVAITRTRLEATATK
jgi:ubiquinone/menaquinone biosynthesis C-methylase UbiE